MAGLQSREGRMMIDSVVWAQYINVTDTQTATQPRRHSSSRPNALRLAEKLGYLNPHVLKPVERHYPRATCSY